MKKRKVVVGAGIALRGPNIFDVLDGLLNVCTSALCPGWEA